MGGQATEGNEAVGGQATEGNEAVERSGYREARPTN